LNDTVIHIVDEKGNPSKSIGHALMNMLELFWEGSQNVLISFCVVNNRTPKCIK